MIPVKTFLFSSPFFKRYDFQKDEKFCVKIMGASKCSERVNEESHSWSGTCLTQGFLSVSFKENQREWKRKLRDQESRSDACLERGKKVGENCERKRDERGMKGRTRILRILVER